MREIKELLVSKINELIDNGTVDRVIGWKAGEFCYDVSPAISFIIASAAQTRVNF